MKRTFVGLFILLFAMVFACVETAYFGSRWLPSCPAEVLCDGLASVGFIIGLVLVSKR